ncbi:unnamed protein product [Nezara viridula]|uniref:Uncharacterized protein n=1 Tax=Nezara viridula TaxID=85310 RepID=A0A9P0EFB2_NEZVI|nr:unnamed protein product [Nezara viridula]
MCRGCLPIILGGLTSPILARCGDCLLGLLSPGCLGVVPLSFLAVLPHLSLQHLGIASSGVAEPWMCRGCLPTILGGLTSPILATSGDCLLGGC